MFPERADHSSKLKCTVIFPAYVLLMEIKHMLKGGVVWAWSMYMVIYAFIYVIIYSFICLYIVFCPYVKTHTSGIYMFWEHISVCNYLSIYMFILCMLLRQASKKTQTPIYIFK